MTVTEIAFAKGDADIVQDDQNCLSDQEDPLPIGFSCFFKPNLAQAISNSGALATLCKRLGWERLVADESRNVKDGDRGALVLRCLGTRQGYPNCPTEALIFIDDNRRFGLNEEQIFAFGAAACSMPDKVDAFGLSISDAQSILLNRPYIRPYQEIVQPSKIAA
ncbi:MAG TPA: hypothetical protein VNE40_00900 [Candidatus Dormibacteraeota bacterium]|nr:hypothetical protein [Candidatus Dormibacteraeota bacterium]